MGEGCGCLDGKIKGAGILYTAVCCVADRQRDDCLMILAAAVAAAEMHSRKPNTARYTDV